MPASRASALAPFEVRSFRFHWPADLVCAFLKRRLSSNPLVEIHEYEGADHAFARHGSPVYDAKYAERALKLSLQFFHHHLR